MAEVQPPKPADLSWLSELNPQQREAAVYTDGPLLVVAGAGSGKTKTLAYRVAYLISQGVQPERILLLTFTRRASQEMLKRASGVVESGASVMSRVWGGTFHAIANRILRIYAKPAGLSPDFTIMDQADAEDLMNVIRNDLGLAKKDKRFPRKGTCQAIYSRRMNTSEDLEPILKRYYPWCLTWKDDLTALYKEYTSRKLKQNILDYDDLLLYWYYLLDDEALADAVGGRFDHVLVDEYQDTNRIQAGILHGMRRKNKNIMVVGDDAQSIYSFRSATVRNMMEFPQQFPGSKVITLEQNYRSVEPILTTTNLVIAQAKERYSKELWSSRKGGQRPQLITCQDETAQDDMVIERVLEHYEQGVALRRQAVLFRASSHSASLEIALGRKNIPFVKYGGLKFLEAAHVKDLVSILRILENPQDEMAWFRILQLLNGIGPATASEVIRHLSKNGFDPRALREFKPPSAASEDFGALDWLFNDLHAMSGDGPSPQIDRIRRFYIPVLKKNYDNAESRSSDIEHLGQLASGYTSRKKFLSDLILDPPSSTGDLAGPPTHDEDWLVLSTIHSAKGCEWDAVYVIHASDGCLPSDMATGSMEETEEELRLAYVAMTRAKDFLYVLWPLRYYHKGGYGMSDAHSYAQCSRFLTEDVRATMDAVDAGGKEAEDAEEAQVEGPVKKDIASRLKGLWE